MLVVIATLPGKPEKREELTAALTKAAVASRSDAGCVSYAFHVDLEDADRFVSVEVWQDQASLDAHFQTPHLAELLGK
ncbi:MAG: putative quinol monooxygenase, partial [Mycobacteriales bacterium]